MNWLGIQDPRDLLAREDIDPDHKIEILRQWEEDLRERLVAEEESMAGPETSDVTLAEVHEALAALGAEPRPPGVPTIHG